VEKKESPKGKTAVKPVISLPSEKWVLKIGFLKVSLFGILYQVDSLSLPLLFGLVGIYPVPLSAGYSSVSSSCLSC